MPKNHAVMLLCVVLCLGVVEASHAAISNAALETVSELQEALREQTEQWMGPVKRAAQWLLMSLALLAFTWTGFQMVLKNADFQEILTELVRMILTVGFFLALILNAETWSSALIEGFMWVGNQASGSTRTIGEGSLDAAGLLGRGFKLASDIQDSASGHWSPVTVGVIFIVSFIAFLIYAAIAAYCLLALAEAYIVTAAGILFLGFGSAGWTSEYAKRYITYCVSIGAKLYAIFLVIGLGEQFIYGWALGEDKNAVMSSIAVVGVLLLLLLLVKMIPDIVQGLINGVSLGGGSPSVTGMLMGVGGLTAAGAAVAGSQAVGGAAALHQAYKLAGAQGAAALGGGGALQGLAATGSMVGAAKDSLGTLGRTGANLAKAAGGTMAAKTLANAAAAQSLKAERIQMGPAAAPKAPAGPSGIPEISQDPFTSGSAQQAYGQMSHGYVGGGAPTGPSGAGAKPAAGLDPLEQMASGYMGGGSYAASSEGAGQAVRSWSGGVDDIARSAV